MNYEEAKQYQENLEAELKRYSDILNSFPKGPMNLTPDAVRATPEWQQAKRGSELVFQKLRKFNAQFNKVFKKEIIADRDARRQAKLAQLNKPVQESKRTFIQFLTETENEFNAIPSFYNLYTTEFPSSKVKKMKDGKKKEVEKDKEQADYDKLLTDFLQHAGVMNK